MEEGGSCEARDGWRDRGRLTWSSGNPVTDTARCAINMAVKRIDGRRKARKEAGEALSGTPEAKPAKP